MRVAVICPALNEEATVGTVISLIPRHLVDESIVVDNDSQDRTAEVAAAAGAVVISQPVRGYGAACLAGARAAQADLLVFMDADGSFDPLEIERLLEPLQAGQAELVLGSRTKAAHATILPHQRFGNWLAVKLLGLLYGLPVTDLGPFRAIRREGLLQLGMSELTYGWPIEMMILAASSDHRIVEVPVSYGPRLGGQSKVSGTLRGSVLAGYHIVKTILRSARRARLLATVPGTQGDCIWALSPHRSV